MKHIGRKLYHLLGGLGLLSLYPLLGPKPALWTYTALAGATLVFEIVRLRMTAFNDLLFERFGSFLRTGERNRMTGTVPYLLGIGLSLLFYRTDIAMAAICYLAVGDVAATTVGERFGRTRIAGAKSLEGTIAFFVAAAAAGGLLMQLKTGLTPGLVLAGAAVAAAAELLPLPLNDNLVIPIVSGGAMELIVRTFGVA